MMININDLKSVSGIGDKTIQRIRETLLVSDSVEVDGEVINYPLEFTKELNQFYIGESVNWMRRNLPNNFVDLTVTSPPYDNLRTYKGFEFDYKSMLEELYRVTKDGGVVVWIVGDATINGSETGTSFKQALYAKEIGFNLHDTMVWKKSNPFNFGSNNCYIQSFEYMFVFSKNKPKTLNFIYDRENKTEGEVIISQFRNGDWMEYDRDNSNYVTKKYGKRYNVWEIPTTSGKGLHPAVFPEELVKDHILSWSNEGDIVLDPMCGSGTTCKMAFLNNRNFIGLDMSEEYINEVCKPRLIEHGWEE